MIILRIIEILLGFERVYNRKGDEVLVPVDSGKWLPGLLCWKTDHFFFHGKAGFYHIDEMNRILLPAFLSLFLPYRVSMDR